MAHNSLLKRYRDSEHQAGFGLVELMVSISVMVIVTSVILAKHTSYNGSSLLRSQLYELALTVREMQLLAVSSTRVATSTSAGYDNVYGLVFSTSTPNSFVIFKDADGDYYYDSGSEEFGSQGVIDARYEVSRIELLGTGADVGQRESITILFERPNFDALFYKGVNTEVLAGVNTVEIDVRLKGTSGTGPNEVRTLEITRAGQIAVKNL
jgi:type II secretory pathway pseudopilin PulG